VNLGNGHLPLRRSSATNFTSTDLHRSNRDKIASCVIAPSSWLDADVDRITNENCSRVSKHAFANDSRSLRLDSVSKHTSAQQSKQKHCTLDDCCCCCRCHDEPIRRCLYWAADVPKRWGIQPDVKKTNSVCQLRSQHHIWQCSTMLNGCLKTQLYMFLFSYQNTTYTTHHLEAVCLRTIHWNMAVSRQWTENSARNGLPGCTTYITDGLRSKVR